MLSQSRSDNLGMQGAVVRHRLRQRACRGLCSEILELQALLDDMHASSEAPSTQAEQEAGATTRQTKSGSPADALLQRQVQQHMRLRR